MSLPKGLGGMAAPQPDQAQQQQEKEEVRRTMLAQILSEGARERLARISIVKSDKARGVEDMIIRMAQSGQIRGKVTEQQLIDMLGQISEQHTTKPKITYNRRRMDDSDSDIDFGL
jgi:programmed cell death protein 5